MEIEILLGSILKLRWVIGILNVAGVHGRVAEALQTSERENGDGCLEGVRQIESSLYFKCIKKTFGWIFSLGLGPFWSILYIEPQTAAQRIKEIELSSKNQRGSRVLI